jgi:hypothetical protein
MYRIEQLERQIAGDAAPEGDRAGGETGGQPQAASPSPARAARAGTAPSAAVAQAIAEPEPKPVAEAPPAPQLGRLQELWPAVAEAVRERSGMMGALLAEAKPIRIEGERLTVAFPIDATFAKKKAEANRELVAGAVRGLIGQGLTVAYELSGEAAPAAVTALSEEELLERLRTEFGAEELFEDDESEEA